MGALERVLPLSLFLAPLLGFLASATGYQGTGTMAEELDWVEAHPGAWLFSTFLWIVEAVVWIVAATVAYTAFRGRHAALAATSWILLVVGNVAHASVVAYSAVSVPLVRSNIDRAAANEFAATHMYNDPAFTIILLPFLGFYLGLVILALTMRRARLVPIWTPILVVAALGLGIAWHHPASNEATFLLLLAAWSPLGWRLLHEAMPTPPSVDAPAVAQP